MSRLVAAGICLAIVLAGGCGGGAGSDPDKVERCINRADAIRTLDSAVETVRSLDSPVCFDGNHFAAATGDFSSESAGRTAVVFQRIGSGWQVVAYGSHGGFCWQMLNAGVPLPDVFKAVPFTSYCDGVGEGG